MASRSAGVSGGAGVLGRIVASKEAEIARLRARRRELIRAAEDAPPARSVLGLIAASPRVAVFAEVKRRSPGAGPIAPELDPVALSDEYEAGGARAVSVLTDGPWFGGSLADLRAVAAARRIPVLRKDFLIDEVQVWETRAAGADLALLIVRILDPPLLADLRAMVHDLGMTALVEVHDEGEVEAALKAGARLVGVNNRDLAAFRTDLRATERLSPQVPGDVIVVSESGIRDAGDVRRVAAAGADAVLVGEALVRSENPQEAVAALAAVPKGTVGRRAAARSGGAPRAIAADGQEGRGGQVPGTIAADGQHGRRGQARGAIAADEREGRRVRAKVCGVTTPRDAAAAADAGADYIGAVLSPGHVRSVSPERASELYSACAARRVGVFVDDPPERVVQLAHDLSLHVVQLHGSEPPEVAARIGAAGRWQVWKALHAAGRDGSSEDGRAVGGASWAGSPVAGASPGGSPVAGASPGGSPVAGAWLGGPLSRDALADAVAAYADAVDGVLVDAWSPRAPGGVGRSFAWQGIGAAVRGAAGDAVFVAAGGMTPDNAAAAVHALAPDVLDASSGLESAPGAKDPAKVRAFVAAVRRARRPSDRMRPS